MIKWRLFLLSFSFDNTNRMYTVHIDRLRLAVGVSAFTQFEILAYE